MSKKIVKMEFDEEEAKGTVEISRHGWGVNIKVNGIQVAFIDLHPCNTHPQLLIDDANEDELMAKLVIEEKKRTLFVHKDIDSFTNRFGDEFPGIHFEGDSVFVSEFTSPEGE